MVLKRYVFASLTLAFFVSAMVVPIFATNKASALSGADFKAGRIIDDAIFFNKDAMTVQQIQDFLNAKVPVCDRNNPYTGTVFGIYNAAPYTCIKEYNENVTTKENNIGRFNSNGTPYQVPGGKSAAQIIWDAAQAYSINPQVLIVTLQKETGIITDTWAAPWQYARAMGYACPDSGPNNSANCNTSYYGFYNQVNSAAWQLRRYTTNPDGYNFKGGVTRYIQYNTSTSCGGTNVYIENQATANLYNYTPYQPNAAALSVMNDNTAGGSVTCGAYGNRNFFWYFTKWFGSTIFTGPTAAFHSFSGYPSLKAGESVSAFISYKNIGYIDWEDSTVKQGIGMINLATANPVNSTGLFGATWASNGTRPSTAFAAVYEADGITLAANQHVAKPGQIAKFSFTISAPATLAPGTYRQWIQPVREGTSSWWLGGVGYIDVIVQPTIYSAQFNRFSGYPATMRVGQQSNSWIDYKNVGNVDWLDDVTGSASNSVSLRTSSLSRQSVFGSAWQRSDVLASSFAAVYEADGITLAANQHVAKPGQIARFSFKFTVPSSISDGTYKEPIDVYVGGVKSMNGWGFFNIGVSGSDTRSGYHSLNSYPTLRPGETKVVWIKYKNTGTANWYDFTGRVNSSISPVTLAMTKPINRSSIFNTSWPNASRPSIYFSAVYEADGLTLAPNQHIVEPGQIAMFQFNVTAPIGTPTGVYREWLQPVLEGSAKWDIGSTGFIDITVTN